MVLLGEAEEKRYRLAHRSLAEALVAVPAAGIQSYLKSYEIFREKSDLSYFSPVGCKQAPLRNMKLENVIRQQDLLQDGRYTTFLVQRHRGSKLSYLIFPWLAFTWTTFAAVPIICTANTGATWIGLSTYIVFTAWSVLLRLVEYYMAYIPAPGELPVNQPQCWDAAVFLGRGNSALVLEGSRQDIKHWTGCGILYKERALGLPAPFWQFATRSGTLLVLIFIFVAIPNGTPTDQLLFVVSNILGQINVLLGYWFNARFGLESLERVEDLSGPVRTRTDVYARILRQFQEMKNKEWVEKVGLLPDTSIWKKWRDQVTVSPGLDWDPKSLYNKIFDDEEFSKSTGTVDKAELS